LRARKVQAELGPGHRVHAQPVQRIVQLTFGFQLEFSRVAAAGRAAWKRREAIDGSVRDGGRDGEAA